MKDCVPGRSGIMHGTRLAPTVRIGRLRHADTRSDPGPFRDVHDFHQTWTVTLCNALNEGILPAGYFAMLEQRQRVGGPIADVLAMELALPQAQRRRNPRAGWRLRCRRRGPR